jgi:hypothetical protein
MTFLFDVASDEQEVIECRPIAPVLHQMSDLVLAMIIAMGRDGLL